MSKNSPEIIVRLDPCLLVQRTRPILLLQVGILLSTLATRVVV